MEVIFPAYHSVPIYIALPLARHNERSLVPARNAEIERDINKYGYGDHSRLGFPIFHRDTTTRGMRNLPAWKIALVRDKFIIFLTKKRYI